MDDVHAAQPVRPNLWADRLMSYAFSVEATIGQSPMRYLLARRFDQAPPTQALTLLFVIRPQVLFGTYVRIGERAVGGDCEIHTYLPTMARPVEVAEELAFDCLPLTDVGYLDLMAWPHPGLRPLAAGAAAPAPAPAADAADADSEPGADPAGAAPTMTLHYAGPPSLPSLTVRDVVDVELSMVVRRILYRDDQQFRRWEIIQPGESGQEALPLRIKVARPQTNHETEFVRTSNPIVVPPELFDADPAGLRGWIAERLIG
jgi:hypothetical protein